MNEISRQRPVRQPAITQAAEGLPRRRWTVAEIERLTEQGVFGIDGGDHPREHFELIGGEIVPMCAKGAWHETMKKELSRFWFPKLTPEIDLVTETTFRYAVDSFIEPDFFFWPRAIDIREIAGTTALLVVEVADTSLGRDLGFKVPVYASLGVRDYWVIDARERRTHIHRGPDGQGYHDVRTFGEADQLTPLLVPSLAVRLADLSL